MCAGRRRRRSRRSTNEPANGERDAQISTRYFALAIADFHESGSMVWSREALPTYLYDRAAAPTADRRESTWVLCDTIVTRQRPGSRFAADSPLEESGFEPLVPLTTETLFRIPYFAAPSCTPSE